MSSKPVLHDGAGNTLEVPEKDWKEFLDRELKLSDGTIVQYREFDRLGPEFWALYPEDWEQVAAQLHNDLVAELNARKIAHWGLYSDGFSPLNRYAVSISDRHDTALGRIASKSMGQGSSLMFHPAGQMGIVSPVSRGSPSLPLSWLGMEDCHVCAYENTVQAVISNADELTLIRTYLGGDTGKIQLAGMIGASGDFRNHWSDHQRRRGTRAFRELKTMLSEEHGVKEAEFTLAEEIKQSIALIRSKISAENHKQFADKIAEYLTKTGVPTTVIISPDGLSYDIQVMPLSKTEWQKFYEDYTTAGGDKPEVDQSSEMPELVNIARSVMDQGYDTIFNTFAFVDVGSNIDSSHARLILSPLSLFSQHPIERFLIGSTQKRNLPEKSSSIRAMATSSKSKFQMNLPVPSRFEFVLARARQLKNELTILKTNRRFLSTKAFSTLFQFKLSLLTADSLELVAIRNLSKTISQLNLDLDQLQVAKALDGVVTAVAQGHDKEQLSLFIVRLPKGIKEKTQMIAKVRRLISEAQAIEKSAKSKTIDEIVDFIELNQGTSGKKNILTEEQLLAIHKRDKEITKANEELFSAMNAIDNLEALFKDRTWGHKIKNDELREAAKARMTEELGTDEALLKDYLARTKSYLLQKDSEHDFYDGVQSFIADEWSELLVKAVENFPELVVSAAKEIAAHSKSSAASTVAIGLLQKAKAADSETFELLKATIAKGKIGDKVSSWGPQNWAIFTLGELFPNKALEVLTPYILSDSNDKRSAIFRTLDKKLYSKQALLNAIKMIGTATNGGPGPDGYIANSKTQDPEVIEAIVQKFLASEKPYFMNHIIESLQIKNQQVREVLVKLLQGNPEEDTVTSSSISVLYMMNPNDPFVHEQYAALIVRKTWIHAWSYLKDLDRLSKFNPNHPAVKIGIEKLQEELKKSNHAGFDHKKFDAVKARAK